MVCHCSPSASPVPAAKPTCSSGAPFSWALCRIMWRDLAASPAHTAAERQVLIVQAGQWLKISDTRVHAFRTIGVVQDARRWPAVAPSASALLHEEE